MFFNVVIYYYLSKIGSCNFIFISQSVSISSSTCLRNLCSCDGNDLNKQINVNFADFWNNIFHFVWFFTQWWWDCHEIEFFWSIVNRHLSSFANIMDISNALIQHIFDCISSVDQSTLLSILREHQILCF